MKPMKILFQLPVQIYKLIQPENAYRLQRQNTPAAAKEVISGTAAQTLAKARVTQNRAVTTEYAQQQVQRHTPAAAKKDTTGTAKHASTRARPIPATAWQIPMNSAQQQVQRNTAAAAMKDTTGTA